MAIQMRRGADNKFDPAKMLPAEIAVTVDGTRKVYAAFGPGDVKELASKEEVQNIVNNFTGTVDKKIAEAVKQVTDEAQEQIDNIENKAQEVLDSIPADYQNAVKQVEKNTLAIFDLDRFKASAILQKASGRNIVINDSAKAGISGMRTLGKSEQRKTTGAQLVDVNEPISSGYYKNGSIIGNSNFIAFKIPVTKGTYYQSGISVASNDPEVTAFNGDTYISSLLTYKNGLITVPSGVTHLGLACRITESSTFMLNAGSEPLPWEPFTGCIAAPNPQYPQPIVNAGQKMVDGWQLFDDRAELANNPNVLNVVDHVIKITAPTASTYLSVYYQIDVDPNKIGSTVYLKTNNIEASGNNKPTVSLRFYNASGTEIGIRVDTVNKYQTISKTIPSECAYMRLLLYSTYDVVCNVGDYAEYEKIMVSYSDVDWEPYTGGVKKAVDVPIETEVLGKNLFDTSKIQIGYLNAGTGEFIASGGNYCSDYIFINGKNITISTKDAINMYGIALYDSEKKFIKCEKAYNVKSYTAITNNAMYARVWIASSEEEFANCEPMIRFAEITDDTHEPYTKQTLTINKPGGFPGIPVTDASLANYTDENGKMWCCDERDWDREIYVGNLLENTASNRTDSGLTFTRNSDDGSITVNGTPTVNIYHAIGTVNLQRGDYVLSGCPNGGGSAYQLYVQKSGTVIGRDNGSGATIALTDDANELQVWVAVYANVTVSDLTFYPMLRPVEIDGIPTSASYVPYTDGKMVKRRGADVRRVGELSKDAVWYNASIASGSTGQRFVVYTENILKVRYSEMSCSHFTQRNVSSYSVDGNYISNDEIESQSGRVCLRFSEVRFSSVEEFSNWWMESNAKIQYILATPIYTHITEKEASAQMALHTNYQSTTILSDADVEVDYVTDTKTYIDNKFAELAAAYVAGSEV